jgi:hypothetical protein
VESTEKVDEGVTSRSGVTKCRLHSVGLALASVVAEKAHVVDDENCVFLKQKRSSMTNATRRWQEVWRAKFTWAEGEINGTGNLTGVACWICTRINGRKKVIVSKGDILGKHEGKRVCKVDGVPYPGLEVGNFYIKKDCKYLRNQALWSARQSAPMVIQQVICNCQAETNRKGVQFSTLSQVLYNGRPMVDYCET